jgi:hypothetical protein
MEAVLAVMRHIDNEAIFHKAALKVGCRLGFVFDHEKFHSICGKYFRLPPLLENFLVMD